MLVTLAAVALYRLGCHIPLPGIDVEALAPVLQSGSGLAGLDASSIMALGVMPWFSALILAEVVALILPGAGQYRGPNAEPRPLYGRAVVVLALVFAVFQAAGYARALEQVDNILIEPNESFRMTAIASLVGGTMLLMVLARVISRHGIGSGFWVLLTVPMLSLFVARLAAVWQVLQSGDLSAASAALSLGLLLAAAAAVVGLLRALEKSGGTTSTGALDGVIWPLLLASTLIGWAGVLPWFTSDGTTAQAWTEAMAPGRPLDLVLMALLTAMFVWLYALRATPIALPWTTATVLVLVYALPVAATAYLDVPLLLDGRWIVVLVAVLFSVAKLWQSSDAMADPQ